MKKLVLALNLLSGFVMANDCPEDRLFKHESSETYVKAVHNGKVYFVSNTLWSKGRACKIEFSTQRSKTSGIFSQYTKSRFYL